MARILDYFRLGRLIDRDDVPQYDPREPTEGISTLQRTISGPGVSELRNDQSIIRRLASIRREIPLTRDAIRGTTRFRAARSDEARPIYEAAIINTPAQMQSQPALSSELFIAGRDRLLNRARLRDAIFQMTRQMPVRMSDAQIEVAVALGLSDAITVAELEASLDSNPVGIDSAVRDDFVVWSAAYLSDVANAALLVFNLYKQVVDQDILISRYFGIEQDQANLLLDDGALQLARLSEDDVIGRLGEDFSAEDEARVRTRHTQIRGVLEFAMAVEHEAVDRSLIDSVLEALAAGDA